MKTNAGLLAVVAIGLIGIVLLVFTYMKTGDTAGTLNYSNQQYGISFTYPDRYALTESEVGDPREQLRYHHSIVLVNREDAKAIPPGGEGPRAISLDIYQNNLDNLTVENWIRERSDSNFKLSVDGRLRTLSMGGTQSYAYTWDGLYRGDSYVFSHGANIMMFTVTYDSLDNQIHKDMDAILASVSLY